MSQIDVYDVMPGCKLVKCGEEAILLGIPPEVIKAITLRKLPYPTTLLIPDRIVIGTNLQNCTEFPLYHFLFFSKGLSLGKRLKIVGRPKALENNLEVLRLTLLGPSPDELKNTGVDEKLIEMFSRESLYFQEKDPDGKPYDITRFVENVPFAENEICSFSGVEIKRIKNNVYAISYEGETVEVDINTSLEQLPPYHVQHDCTPNELCKFGIEILGGATGFSATNASSGLVIVYNGTYILVDSIPFLDHHLVARGVAKSQVRSVFLSHIHDDHCNLFPLMYSVNKVRIITTKEIYWMAIKKMSLMLDLSVAEVMGYFDLVPLEVGKTLNYYGIKVKPHYTVHTIPTVGAEFIVSQHTRNYSVLITSDNQSLTDIDQMLNHQVIDDDRATRIRSIYKQEVDILFADGGEGVIHGNPRDALESMANRVVFFHLDQLSPEFNATFSVASAGKRYVVIQGQADYYTTKAVEFIMSHFEEMDLSWVSILLGNIEITRYNSDDVIIKQGDPTKNKIYLIITGYCSVVTHDGKSLKNIARKEAGDMFGEMAVTQGTGSRNASVLAMSPVTLCEMSEEIFFSLIIREGFKDKLIGQWDYRRLLERLPFFKDFPHLILERLSIASTLNKYKAGEEIPVSGEKGSNFYIILSGEVVRKNEEGLLSLKAGDYFGDFGQKTGQKGIYNSKEDSHLLAIEKQDMVKILMKTPQLLFRLKNKALVS